MHNILHEDQLKRQFSFQQDNWDSFEQFKEALIEYIRDRDARTLTVKLAEGGSTSYKPHIHTPLKTYEVWSQEQANYPVMNIGKVEARNFAEACHKLASKHYLKEIARLEQDPESEAYIGHWGYDPQELSFWGTKWFPTKEMAEKLVL